METKKIKPGPWGVHACDKLMEINRRSLIKAIINYVCWSSIDWKTVWVTAMLSSGAVSDESWRVGPLKHPLRHLSYPASSLWSSGTLRVTCRDTDRMIHKMMTGFTRLQYSTCLHCTASHLMTKKEWRTGKQGFLFIRLVEACFGKIYVYDDAPALHVLMFDQHCFLCLHYSWSIATSAPVLSSPSICVEAWGHRSLHPRFTLRKLLPPTSGNTFSQ